MDKSISEKIKALRKKIKLTQEELSSISNISLSAIRKYETGERIPKYETISSIAEALKTDISYLLNEEYLKIKKEVSAQNSMIEFIKYSGFTVDINPTEAGDIESVYLSLGKIEFNLSKKEFQLLFENICSSVRTNTLNAQFYKDLKEINADGN